MKPQSHFAQFLIGIILFFILEATWIYAIFFAPSEKIQGDIYRIIYLHVPAAFTAMVFCSLALLVTSIWGLVKKSETCLFWGRACAEVGFLFTLITLASGSLWGKPTWGTFWVWDARLTTTFLLGILYGAYLLLHQTFEPGIQRIKVCSILGILIFIDTPIIYKSVTWWRTLHQPPSMFRPGGADTIAPEMMNLILLVSAVMFGLAFWFIKTRTTNLAMMHELEDKMLERAVTKNQ